MDGFDAKNWRKRLSLMRTIALFREESPDARRLGEAIDRGRSEALQAAAVNPDHSETAARRRSAL